MWTALVYSLAQTAVGFAASWMLAVWLGVEDRGVLAAITMPLLLVTQVTQFAAPHATQYFIASGRASAREVMARGIWSVLLTGTLCAAGLAAAAPWLLRQHPQHVTLLQVLCVTIPATMCVNVARSVLQARRHYRLVNWETLAGPVLRVAALVPVHLVTGLSVTAAALVVAIGPLLVGSPLVAAAILEARRHRVVPVDGGAFSAAEFRRFQLQAAPGLVANNANRFLDRVVLAAGLVSPTQLGLYVLATSITEPANSLFASLRAVHMTETARREGRADPVVMRRISAAGVIVALGVLAVVPFVPLIYGAEYSPARLPLAILALAVPAAVIRGSSIQVLLASNQPHRQSITQWVALGVGLVALLMLAPTFGAIGAAVASLLAYGTSAELGARWATHRSAIHQFPRLTDLRSVVADGLSISRGVPARWRHRSRRPRTNP